MKKLTNSLYQKYINQAKIKTDKDFNALHEFAKSRGLDCSYARLSGENEARLHFEVAKELWEADGYVAEPASFTRINEREKEFTKNIITGKKK
jgi:hypothetical protein